MKRLFSTFLAAFIFGSLTSASANQSYVCKASKVTSAAPPAMETNFSCDFANNIFLHPMMGEMAKRTCEVQFKDKNLKLDVGTKKLIYFNGHMEKTLTRFDHQDGIGGTLLSDGQYQHILTFNPEMKWLTAISINPFMGTQVVISECESK